MKYVHTFRDIPLRLLLGPFVRLPPVRLPSILSLPTNTDPVGLEIK